MGTAKPDSYTNDPIALAMVRAAAEEMRKPGQPLTAPISVAEMARRVGVTERTGYNKWDAEDFQIALVREVLSLDIDDAHIAINPDKLADAARAIIDDKTISFRVAMQILFDTAWQSLIDDPRKNLAAALVLYSHGEGRVAQETRASVIQLYTSWVNQIMSVVDSFVARYSRHVSVRTDLNTEDMAVVAMSLAYGAAIQIPLDERMNQQRIKPELPGMVLQALLAYALVFHDDEGPHPMDAHLSRLDEISEF